MKNNPEMDLEIVREIELQGANFSISNKKLINCKFISCNILYSGGPFHLEGCEFGHCIFFRIGPMEDAFNNVAAEKIKGNLLKCWDDLKFLWDPDAGVDDKGNINFGKTNT
jgi:hypothetical protein